MKAKGDCHSVAVATTTFIYGMCDCMVDSDVDKGDLSLLHVCGHTQVRSHVSQGIDWWLVWQVFCL